MQTKDLKEILKSSSEKNCYMACVWPAAGLSEKERNRVEGKLREVGQIIMSKDVYLTYRGMKNFMAEIYGHQSWTGNIKNHFRGVRKKADMCFRADRPVTTYLFTADSLECVLEVKDRIRKEFNMGNHSIHISDNQSETECMIGLLYIRNSVDFLNCAKPFKYSNVFCKIKELKNEIQRMGLQTEHFILGGDVVLEICGIKKAEKFVVLSDYQENEITELLTGDWKYGGQIPEALKDSENYFYFEGMKFMSVRFLFEETSSERESEESKMYGIFLDRIDDLSKGEPERVIASISQVRTVGLNKIKRLIRGKE